MRRGALFGNSLIQKLGVEGGAGGGTCSPGVHGIISPNSGGGVGRRRIGHHMGVAGVLCRDYMYRYVDLRSCKPVFMKTEHYAVHKHVSIHNYAVGSLYEVSKVH